MIHREEGVTLIELLASVVLGSLLVGSLMALVAVGFQSYEAAKRSLSDGAAINEVRASLTDDARSASPSLTSVSPDGLTLTLVIFDHSPQNASRRSVVYQYVSDGTITRTVTVGTNQPSAQIVTRNLTQNFASPVFAVSGSSVLANVPLPLSPTQTMQGSPVQTVEVKIAMRVQSP